MDADRTARRGGLAEPRKHASFRERVLLACGAVGPPLFVAVLLVSSLVHPPGYDPLQHTVSAFVLGPFGWVQSGSFLVTGGLLLAFAFGLRLALRRYGSGRWAPVLVGLLAVGLIGSGVFATDPAAAGRTGWAVYSAGTAVAFLTGFVLASMAQPPLLPPVGGLLQRITIILGWSWLTALAVHLFNQANPATRTTLGPR